jgi:hypothetical protein
MRRFILMLMLASFVAVACASQEKAKLDQEGVKKRSDETHKSMGTY